MAETVKLADEATAHLPEGYKVTDLGPLPEEWQVVKLESIFDVVNKKAREVRINSDERYLLLTVRLYAKGVTARGIATGSKIGVSKLYRTEEDDFVFSKIDARNGAWGFIPPELAGGLVSNDFPILRLNESCALREFMELLLSQPKMWEPLRAIAVGTTNRRRIKPEHFFELKVPLPPISEQRAIAHVLSTVRKALQASEKVLAAARELKNSLMRHLFTYGPVPVEEAERVPLRETEIGLIPEQWSVVRLGDIAQKPQYGLTASSVSSPIGPKLLRVTDIQDGKVKWDEVPYCKISEDVCSKYRLEPGDLLVARIGATTGKTFLVSECPESVFGSYLIRVRVYQDRLLPPFLYYFTQTQYYWSQINAVKDGRLKKGINIPILSSLQVPLPSLREQEEIVRLLSALDWKIQVEEIRIQALDVLFKAVLHLLMTGRVRVKDLPRCETEGVSPSASRE